MDDSPDTPRKQCKGPCQQFFPATKEFFYGDKSKRDGLRWLCKQCDNATSGKRQRKKQASWPKSKSDLPPGFKQCTGPCQRILPATSDYFYQMRTGKYGVMACCKQCTLEKAHQRVPITRERKALYTHAYYQKHRERIDRYKREWRITHAEQMRTYYRDHPEINKKHHALRRTRKLSAGGTFTTKDIQKQYERQHGKCYYCRKKLGKNYHVDHVVPLTRGGSNGPENLVVACPSCNHSKNNKLPHEWPQGGRLM